MVNGMRWRNKGDIMGKDERLERETISTNTAALSQNEILERNIVKCRVVVS